MTVINIPTVRIGAAQILKGFPEIITPIRETMGKLSPDKKAAIAEGRASGFSPVLVITVDKLGAFIEMR